VPRRACVICVLVGLLSVGIAATPGEAEASQWAVHLRLNSPLAGSSGSADIGPLGKTYAKYPNAEPAPFYHNGEPFFPIGIYHYPGGNDAAHLQELSEAGFNVVRRSISSLTVADLDEAGSYGITVLAYAGAWLGDIGTYGSALEDKVNQTKDHPALVAYETYDEPYWNYFHYGRGYSREALTAGRELVNQLDPAHPVWCNFAPYDLTTTASYNPLTFEGYQLWTSVGNIYGMDRYPVWVGYPANDLNPVNYCCDRLKEIAGDGTTVYMVLQGVGMLEWDDDPENDAERPTYTETRFMGYSSIIHGAKGILYWGQYYIEPDSQLWADLKRFAGELSALKDVLSEGATATEFTVSDGNCEAILKVHEGNHYLIVANRSATTRANVVMSVTGWRSQRADVLFEDRVINSVAGSFTDSFQPWETHVYTEKPMQASTWLAPGWNLISVPLWPVDPRPESVLSGTPISGSLYRYDYSEKGYVAYSESTPEDFGPVEVGAGYWLNCASESGCNVAYDGYTDSGPLEIDLPTPGWHLIGASHQACAITNLTFTRGALTRSFSQAVAAGWIANRLWAWENGTYAILGTDPWCTSTTAPWAGYWLYTFVEDVTMEVPVP